MSWICPKCGTLIGDRAVREYKGKQEIYVPVACPECAIHKSHEAWRELQRAYVADALKGYRTLTVLYPSNTRQVHVRPLGEPRETWCGKRSNKKWFKEYPPLDERLRARLCPRCREILDDLEKEIRRAEVA